MRRQSRRLRRCTAKMAPNAVDIKVYLLPSKIHMARACISLLVVLEFSHFCLHFSITALQFGALSFALTDFIH
ncbi:hypothetical protein SDJN03_22060, partial [Cucurbita argyrosperma subsp. sororia]